MQPDAITRHGRGTLAVREPTTHPADHHNRAAYACL